jgi:ABC-type sugar transport system, periplasmic component
VVRSENWIVQSSQRIATAGEITVVFIPKVTGNAFFESANEGAQRFAERIGFSVEYTGSPEASVDRQRAIISNSIKRQVSAICISSLDATALDDDLKAAMAAGVKVTTWDSDVSGDARTLMVSQGTPDVLGKMLVDMAVKSLTSRGINPDKDKVRYVWHYSRANVADQNSWRDAGETYIKGAYPNWTNVKPENYYSDQDPKKALQVGEEILADHPDIDVPGIGTVTVYPNSILDPDAYTAEDSGVVLLPERVEFTLANMDKYDF